MRISTAVRVSAGTASILRTARRKRSRIEILRRCAAYDSLLWKRTLVLTPP